MEAQAFEKIWSLSLWLSGIGRLLQLLSRQPAEAEQATSKPLNPGGSWERLSRLGFGNDNLSKVSRNRNRFRLTRAPGDFALEQALSPGFY